MGADDFRLPGFIEKSMCILLQNPDLGIACSDFGYIKGDSNETEILTDKYLPDLKTITVFKPNQILQIFQKTDFWIAGHTSIIKRESVLKHKYNPALKFLCDWFLLHRIALVEGVAYIPETLSVWWIHNQSYSSNFLENVKKKKEVYNNTLRVLFEDEKKTIRMLFMKSGLLSVQFKTIFWDLCFIPKYWPFLFYIGKKSFHWHSRNLKRKILR